MKKSRTSKLANLANLDTLNLLLIYKKKISSSIFKWKNHANEILSASISILQITPTKNKKIAPGINLTVRLMKENV